MFPTIASYNLAIQQNGISVFRNVRAEHFIPSRTKPLRIYSYGAGSFAVVFKICVNGQDYALRCFLAADQGVNERYRLYYEYLRDKPHLPWKTQFEYLDGEILVNGSYYPIVLMEWIEGIAINDYVTRNMTDLDTLTSLQQEILETAASLTDNQLGHGDLQGGNILVTQTTRRLKLIDYDGLYVPRLKGKLSFERGRPEYQHPQRTLADFNETIDWFSVWVMITALEAVKADPNLWKQVYQGGFNTQDNFLFVAEDFIRPEQSRLFKILLDKNDERLNFYANRLLTFVKKGLASVERPRLFESRSANTGNSNGTTSAGNASFASAAASTFASGSAPGSATPPGSTFRIHSDPPAVVLTQNLQRIGTTPCELNQEKYAGKNIILSYGNRTKTLKLSAERQDYRVEFL